MAPRQTVLSGDKTRSADLCIAPTHHGMLNASGTDCSCLFCTMIGVMADLKCEILCLSCQLASQLCNLSLQACFGVIRMLPPVLALCKLPLQPCYRLCLFRCRCSLALQMDSATSLTSRLSSVYILNAIPFVSSLSRASR